MERWSYYLIVARKWLEERIFESQIKALDYNCIKLADVFVFKYIKFLELLDQDLGDERVSHRALGGDSICKLSSHGLEIDLIE